jgi:hypothetical protein
LLRRAGFAKCCAPQFTALALVVTTASVSAQTAGKQPNNLVIFGDDIGQSNISAYSRGLMGFTTPNSDRIGAEGDVFVTYYGQQSCTAGPQSLKEYPPIAPDTPDPYTPPNIRKSDE